MGQGISNYASDKAAVCRCLMSFVIMNFKARLELITSMATSGCVTRYVTVVRRTNTVDYLPAL